MTSRCGPMTEIVRPKPAASIIVLDRSGSGPVRVLMGRRRLDLAFMPGKIVFPGGRVDKTDAPLARAWRDGTHDPLAAYALAAIRECYEETGLALGRARQPHEPECPFWPEAPLVPDHARMRQFARAVTPVGMVRRFDTRFFATFRQERDWQNPLGGPDGELTDVFWVALQEAQRLDIPFITGHVLEALKKRLDDDPDLVRHDQPLAEFMTRANRLKLTWR